MTDWVNERLYPGWGQRFAVTRRLAAETTAFQSIEVIDTASHGAVLLLDGVVQVTARDEAVYQEMIAHVPLLLHGAARRVLIIGAGDGGVLRRVLQHRTVERAVMVEIDAAVIRLSRAYLPAVGGDAWDDPRASVLIADGIAYVGAADAGSFDVIIVDSTDPEGVGEVLFSEVFYRDCARVLGPRGLLVNQGGVPAMQADELAASTARRARAFAHVSAYVVAVPTYVGGFMAIGVASNMPFNPAPDAAEIARRADSAGIGPCHYWSPAVQVAAFALPPYIAAAVQPDAKP